MGFWFTLILFVATFVLSELLRPKPDLENARPSGLGDFDFPTATEGRIVPLVWGTVKLKGPNVVWYGDLQQVPMVEGVKTGIFSKTAFTKGFRTYMGVQMALCRGPVDKLLKIWVEDAVFWEGTGTGTPFELDFWEPEWFGGDDLGNGGLSGHFAFFPGSETQAASSYLTNHQSQGGVTPSYRGTCYVVLGGPSTFTSTITGFYLGNSTRIEPWRFEVQRIPNGLGLADPTVNTKDANPMNVIYELMTNDEWGFGFPSSDVDISNFTTAAATLKTEGNGFSMVLDQPRQVADFLAEIERQVDGVVQLDRLSGKWKIVLARADYDIDTVPQATPSNVLEVQDYSRGAWAETSNEVRVAFVHRDDNYKDTFAFAQDMGNVRVQSASVITQTSYPGVKVPALANNIAWRDLRSLSRPLAKATLIVDRTFYAVNPGEVIAWTEPSLGLTKLAMRVTKIDLGTLTEGKITLSLVEDVFAFEQPSFASPQVTNWSPPDQTVDDIALADRAFFEAPKAIVDRSPVLPGVYRRIFASALHQGDGAVVFDLEVGNELVGNVGGFALAGKLQNALGAEAQGGNVNILADPSGFEEILLQIKARTAEDVGLYFSNLALIGNEFIGFLTASDQTTHIRLETVYRGLMDSVVAAHAANDRVWLLFVASNITDSVFPSTPVSIKPIPYSSADRLLQASATATSVTMGDRHLKPYPPTNLLLNSVSWDTTNVSLDNSISGPDDGLGIQLDFTRKDYRTNDEVKAVLNESSLPSDFPSANNTRYAVEVRNDPAGTNTLLYTTAYANGSSVDLSRTQILRYTNGVLPSSMRVVIKTRHTISSVDYDSLYNITHDFTVTSSALSGDTNLGALNENVTSNQYTAPDTGTYAFSIAQNVLSSGIVEARINGGSWTTVIGTGNTSGNLAGVTSGDTIEVRHTENGANTNQTILLVTAPTAGQTAYGVLII